MIFLGNNHDAVFILHCGIFYIDFFDNRRVVDMQKTKYISTKGHTLVTYAIRQNPDAKCVAVCAPCEQIVVDTSRDQCPSCGYYLAWVRSEKFYAQGVRSDYLDKINI